VTPVLDAFSKLRKAIIGFLMTVHLSVCLSVRPFPWNDSTLIAQIFVEFNA